MKRSSPSRSRGYSAGERLLHLEQRARTSPQTSSTDAIRAPTASYAASGNALPSPAPASTSTSWPRSDELARAGGRQRDAVLVGLDLLGDADPHGAQTLAVSSGDRVQARRRGYARLAGLGASEGSVWRASTSFAVAGQGVASTAFARGAPVGRRDRDVDALVRERPLEQRLRPVSTPNSRSGSSSSGGGELGSRAPRRAAASRSPRRRAPPRAAAARARTRARAGCSGTCSGAKRRVRSAARARRTRPPAQCVTPSRSIRPRRARPRATAGARPRLTRLCICSISTRPNQRELAARTARGPPRASRPRSSSRRTASPRAARARRRATPPRRRTSATSRQPQPASNAASTTSPASVASPSNVCHVPRPTTGPSRALLHQRQLAAREPAGGERGREERRILVRPAAHVRERQAGARLAPARVDRPRAGEPAGVEPSGQATSPRRGELEDARVWWETPRWRSRASASRHATATTGRPPSAAPRSPPRPRRARRGRGRAGPDDPRADRADRDVEALRRGPGERRRTPRRTATSPPKHAPTATATPTRPRSCSARTVSDSETGSAPPGELDVRDAHARAAPAQTGATWLCSEQQTTGMPSSDSRRASPSSSACRAARLTGVYGSFITCAPGSAGEPEPARQVRVQHVEAAGAEAELARLRVHDHLVAERDRAGQPRVRDARRAVHLDPRRAPRAARATAVTRAAPEAKRHSRAPRAARA